MAKQIVFVDGVGGKRYMRGAFIKFFESKGYQVHCFDYSASSQTLEDILTRLIDLLTKISSNGEFYAIGYSFGGVALRIALNQLKPSSIQASKIILLASPLKPMRLSTRLRDWRIYRWMAGECGQFIADNKLIEKVPMPENPTACVVGTWPWFGVFWYLFGLHIENDGMVATDEALPPHAIQSFFVNASHAFIPSNDRALRIMYEWLSDEH